MQTDRIIIYQVLPRLHGNRKTANIADGSLDENGCGKMNDFTSRELKRIHEFGFTHIWYTGLIEHATQTDYTDQGIERDHPDIVKGRAGSPYAIKDYYDIDPDLAENVDERMKEFEALVRRTHRAGLKMVMDFVPNHVARQYKSDAKPEGVRDLGEDDDTTQAFSTQNNFYYMPGQQLHTGFRRQTAADTPADEYVEFPARATGNDRFDAYPGANDWYETVKLNYGVDYCNGHSRHFDPIPDTWKKMTDILLFWAGKGVDAFRCDMAEMVPCEFWQHAIARVKAKHPGIRFIAEIYNPAAYRDYIHRGGFDYLYDKVGLYDTLRAVCRNEASATAISGCWQSIDDIRSHMLNFLENHDEQRIASDFFCGNGTIARPALVVSACMGTNPFMIYAGQELGEKGMDSEGFSGRDGRTTIFDYWSVGSLRRLNGGEKALKPEELDLYLYYRRVVRLLNGTPALRNGLFYDLMYANRHADFQHRCYAFFRKHKENTLLIVCNFDAADATFGLHIPAHAFDFLGLQPGKYAASDLLNGGDNSLELPADGDVSLTVPAHGAVILQLQNI